MTSTQAYETLVLTLQDLYDLREAMSIARIVLEDEFNVKNLSQEISFDRRQADRLEDIRVGLAAHEPLQYILGEADFFGLKFLVNRHVLIPRQETEELVAWVLETVQRPASSVQRVLDVGTGSGCIPVAIKKRRPNLEVHALDVSIPALKVARQNARWNGVEVTFHEVDILKKEAWSDLPKFDIIVSNPPYITESEKSVMPRNVLDYEPHIALFTGTEDPLLFYRAIADFALEKLNPNGDAIF